MSDQEAELAAELDRVAQGLAIAIELINELLPFAKAAPMDKALDERLNVLAIRARMLAAQSPCQGSA